MTRIVKRDRPAAVIGALKQFTELRGKRGMSQLQVGRRSGVHGNTICAMERGFRDPTLRTLTRMADAIGCDVVVKLVPRKRKKLARSARASGGMGGSDRAKVKMAASNNLEGIPGCPT